MTTMHISRLDMRVRQLATRSKVFLVALIVTSAFSLRALAQDEHSHPQAMQHHQLTAAQQSQQSALLQIVRDSTERFQQVSEAEAEGYHLQFGCVSGPDSGAMGLHFVNGALVNSGVIDATRPQIVIYEPTARRTPAIDRRRLSGHRRHLGQAAFRAAAADGTALSLLREPQSLRAPGVLHPARLGMEGQSQRRIRELAPRR